MPPCDAPHSRTAFSMSVSSTASRSNVERLMIFSTSLVAVCCWSASVRSSNRLAGGRKADVVLERVVQFANPLEQDAGRDAWGEAAIALAHLEDVGTRRLAEPRSGVDDGLEHDLQVGRRRGDDTEHLCGGGLL